MALEPFEIRSLKTVYETGEDDIEKDFFRPCLARCASYDRAAGYFRISALPAWTEAIRRIGLGDSVKIRLLISPELSENEREALSKAVDPEERSRLRRQAIDDSMLSAMDLDLEPVGGREGQIQLLAWLVANDHLEIRFAFPEHTARPGIFHWKLGLFRFPSGEEVAFTGSPNESLGGHHRNWETLDVFRSWEGAERPRIESKKLQFTRAWSGDACGLETLGLSESTLEIIRGMAPEDLPPLSPPSSGSRPELRDHQKGALQELRKNGFTGILDMCTGSGKTLTALQAAEELITIQNAAGSRNPLVVIVCPRRVLVDQWRKEIRYWKPEWQTLLAYGSFSQYGQSLQHFRQPVAGKIKVIITTYDTLFDTGLKNQLSLQGDASVALIADEVHNLGSERRIAEFQEFEKTFGWRIGLSATPEIEGEPERTDRLFEYFGGIVYSYSIRQAIEDKVLCPYNYYPVPTFLNEEDSRIYLASLEEADSDDIAAYSRNRSLFENSGLYVAELERLLDRELKGKSIEDLALTILFSPPGFARARDDAHDEGNDRRIIEDLKEVLEARRLLVGAVTQHENARDRAQQLKLFSEKRFHVLLGIGCLDEGLDIPHVRRAILLYSVDREKQFIQRRGRVLRRADASKKFAEIYDLIVLPSPTDYPVEKYRTLLSKQLRRYQIFAELALNQKQASAVLEKALDGESYVP